MGLKDKLEAAGYDTSQLDENQLISKLGEAGYDTSSLAPADKKAINPLDEYKKFTDEMQKTGESMAEKIGEKTSGTMLEKVGPYIGGAVGTAAAMFPDIIGNQVLTPTAKVVGPKMAQEGMELAASGGNKLRSLAEALTGPGADAGRKSLQEAVQPLEQRLLGQKQALSTLPERIASKADQLKQAKTGYGAAIGKAEEVGGFAETSTPEDFINTIKDPKALNEFSQTMRKLADTPLEDLVKTKDTGMLQTARKFGQTFRELGPKLNKEITSTISANVKMGAGKSTEALAKIDETFGSAIKSWEKVDSQLKNLPAQAQKQKAAITQATRNTQYAIKQTKAAMQEAIRAGAKRDDLRKTLLKYGLGALVGGTAFKLFH